MLFLPEKSTTVAIQFLASFLKLKYSLVICSGIFLNIELQPIGLQFPNSSSFQDWHHIWPFQACFLSFL